VIHLGIQLGKGSKDFTQPDMRSKGATITELVMEGHQVSLMDVKSGGGMEKAHFDIGRGRPLLSEPSLVFSLLRCPVLIPMKSFPFRMAISVPS
jgi:hypothetical protein